VSGEPDPGPGHLVTGHTHVHAGGIEPACDGEPTEPVVIGPGIVQIDTLLGGWRRMTAGYLVQGPAPVLIETGSQSSVAVLLAALERLGVGPNDLAGVAVTHIHLDHAGGVGDVARAFPNATVYVHEKGARHLADPTRLVASAERVYGPLLDWLYGLDTPAAFGRAQSHEGRRGSLHFRRPRRRRRRRHRQVSDPRAAGHQVRRGV